ncbi:hypothetical protein OEW28_07420 [Defluviimonas sp. WL0002]|uniref:Uncharacterized protein n=1 Tax=Albidovulum marisflavi TaxID=2984159 RepID=A0ABT2ZCH8_9RHOB|nr:hypothetical protein [Defluviimonas sp. WL0002]MCV2868456.1 hypothetical protein [Defluviimonas sp. WL0002]
MPPQTFTSPQMHAPKPDIIGPYSHWPRRTSKRAARTYALAGSAATAAAVFAHCVVPLI